MRNKIFSTIENIVLYKLEKEGYESKFLDVQGIKFHYIETEGKGTLPPIVFIHGLGGNSTELSLVYKNLRKDFKKIISIDVPGHGLTSRPEKGMNINEVLKIFLSSLDKILDEPSIIFGNSLGGFLALKYANYNPEKVKQLILSSPAGSKLNEEELVKFTDTFRIKTNSHADRFFSMLYHRPPLYLAPIIKEYVKYRFNRPEIIEFLDITKPDDLFTVEELKNISVPTLLIWGKKDVIMKNHLDYFKENFPSSVEIDEPEYFTHSPYIEFQKELGNKILDFVKK